jgi:hypothetical protein
MKSHNKEKQSHLHHQRRRQYLCNQPPHYLEATRQWKQPDRRRQFRVFQEC